MPQSITDIKQEYADYAYAVSHDLGAQVRQIRAFLDLLFDDLDQGNTNDLEDYKTQCFKAIANADLILDRLLQFSRLNTHALDIQSIPIIGFFDTLDERIRISLPDDLTVNIDAHLFRILVEELVDNALKFSTGITEIYLDGQAIVFKTQDITIPTQHLNDIFKPLRALHAKGNDMGCGMGLTIARKAAYLQNMNLFCESDQDTRLVLIYD